MAPRPRPTSHDPDPDPDLCTHGGQLCRVRVLTEAQWQQLPAADRPALAEYVPGLGWVVGVPVESLN